MKKVIDALRLAETQSGRVSDPGRLGWYLCYAWKALVTGESFWAWDAVRYINDIRRKEKSPIATTAWRSIANAVASAGHYVEGAKKASHSAAFEAEYWAREALKLAEQPDAGYLGLETE